MTPPSSRGQSLGPFLRKTSQNLLDPPPGFTAHVHLSTYGVGYRT